MYSTFKMKLHMLTICKFANYGSTNFHSQHFAFGLFTDGNTFICPFCGEVFMFPNTLRAHMRFSCRMRSHGANLFNAFAPRKSTTISNSVSSTASSTSSSSSAAPQQTALNLGSNHFSSSSSSSLSSSSSSPTAISRAEKRSMQRSLTPPSPQSVKRPTPQRRINLDEDTTGGDGGGSGGRGTAGGGGGGGAGGGGRRRGDRDRDLLILLILFPTIPAPTIHRPLRSLLTRSKATTPSRAEAPSTKSLGACR